MNVQLDYQANRIRGLGAKYWSSPKPGLGLHTGRDQSTLSVGCGRDQETPMGSGDQLQECPFTCAFVHEATVRPGDSGTGYQIDKGQLRERVRERECVHVCLSACLPACWSQGLLCLGASNWRHQRIQRLVTGQMECLRAAAGGICIVSMYMFLLTGFHPNQPDRGTGCGWRCCWWLCEGCVFCLYLHGQLCVSVCVRTVCISTYWVNVLSLATGWTQSSSSLASTGQQDSVTSSNYCCLGIVAALLDLDTGSLSF